MGNLRDLLIYGYCFSRIVGGVVNGEKRRVNKPTFSEMKGKGRDIRKVWLVLFMFLSFCLSQ